MKEKRKPTPWLMWCVIGLVLLVGYPLSAGPVLYLVTKGYLPSQCMVCYRPLFFVSRHSPAPVPRVLLYSYWSFKDHSGGNLPRWP